jgi:hypothetical protein
MRSRFLAGVSFTFQGQGAVEACVFLDRSSPIPLGFLKGVRSCCTLVGFIRKYFQCFNPLGSCSNYDPSLAVPSFNLSQAAPSALS